MNIIKLHKSITLNVFAFLALFLYCNLQWVERFLNNAEFKDVIIISCALLAGLLTEFIIKKFIPKNKFNFEIKLPDNFSNPFLTFPLKILYLIVFYIGLSILFLPVNNIILGIILLSFIPINYLRKSVIANLFACSGLVWIGHCYWYYYNLYTNPIQTGVDTIVSFELLLFFIPVTLIATAIFIICMIIELILKKSLFKKFDYGKWFLFIPEFFHLLCLYIGLIGGMFYTLFIYTIMFYIFLSDFWENFLRYL